MFFENFDQANYSPFVIVERWRAETARSVSKVRWSQYPTPSNNVRRKITKLKEFAAQD